MRKVWTPQPKQAEFLSRPEYEVLYGGAAGGGKSDALIAEALRQVHIPQYKGLILRKTYPQLSELIDRSREIYKAAFPRARYNATEHTWTFPSGAKIIFGSMQHTSDRINYQGKRYDFIGFDELTHFSFDEYSYLFSRNRPNCADTRCYIRATCNPGGIGHAWVKERFIAPAPPLTPIDTEQVIDTPDGGEITIKRSRLFVPSTVFDNKILLSNAPEYLASLSMLPEAERNALLYGDWDSFAGQVFGEWRNLPEHYRDMQGSHVITPFEVPDHWTVVRGFDFGYSGYSAFSKAAQFYDSFDDAMKVNAYRQAANRIGESVAKSAFISSFNTQNNITVSQQERAEIQKTGGVIRNYSVKPSRSVSAQIDALEIIGKKYGLAIEAVNTIGGNANGFYDPNTKRIVVALDADEGGIVRVASHELYHHIENVNPADAAQIRSVVISALKAKPDYDYEAQKKWLMSKGYSEADVDSEIVAQSMFDVLNADTIEKLRNENPSLLQKIKNWIDSFFKVLEDAIDRLSTKKYGGAEIRALRNDRETLSKVREMVLDALEKEIQKKSEQTDTNNQSNDVKFSVKDLSEQIEEIQDGTFPRGNHVYVGKTPKILSDVGFNSDLPMLTTVHHIRKAMLPKNEKLHHHGITKKQLSLLPQKIADPVMIMDSLDPKSNAVVVVTDMLDPDGMPIIAIIKADGSGMYNNVEILTNFVLSYYGRKNFANFVQRNVNADTFLYINKEKSRKLSNQAKVQFFGKLNSYDFDTIIRKTNAKVNSKNEKTQIKFSVKDDSDVDTKALMRENEHLKKMLELARGELKRTKGHQVKPGTFEKLANKYKRQYGSRIETSEIVSALQKMYDYIANGEEPNAEVAFDSRYLF